MPDNIGRMFYYGETPWHGKGDELDQPATADEAISHGGLDWEVELIPIVTGEKPATPITKRMAVVRRDVKPGDPARVLGVVHPGFRPLQNREGAKIFDTLIGHGARIYHTGGYLGNGEVVWLLARLPGEIKIAEDDVVEPYMLFTNSHDGSIAVDFRLTTVRVVCQNTLSMALHRRKGSEVFKRAHQGSYHSLEAEADAFFKFSIESVTALGKEFQAMSNVPFPAASLTQFIQKVVPLPSLPGAQASETAKKQYETRVQNLGMIREGIQNVFKKGFQSPTIKTESILFDSGLDSQNGLKIPPAPETLWGALNAVTAFVDHAQEIKGDRYAHILFGRGADLKQTAYKVALNYLPDQRIQA